MTIKKLSMLVSIISLSTTSHADDRIKLSVNFIDLAMYSQENSTGSESTNSAELLLNSDIKINYQDVDLGMLKMQYTLNGLNTDAQLNTRKNWFGGVGSYIGGAINLNDIAPSQLSLLTWDKKSLDNHIYTSVGRTNLRRYFLFNNCQNIALCTDPIKLSMGSLPSNYGYWGGYLKYQINENFYIHSGIFEVNTDDYIYEKKGLDFSFNHKDGYTQIYSLGYQQKKNKIEALYFLNNSEYSNPLSSKPYKNTEGFNIRFSYDPILLKRTSFYGTYSKNLEKSQAYNYYVELGLNHDLNIQRTRIGVKIGQSRLNDDYYAITQMSNGNKNQTTSFLSFDAAIKYKMLTISPFVQYIWNPDNYYRSNNGSFDHNVIVGLLTQIKLF